MSIDKNTNEGKNYRNNVVKSTSGTSKSRINTGFYNKNTIESELEGSDFNGVFIFYFSFG